MQQIPGLHSRTNPLVKHAAKLRHRAYRHDCGEFLLEGHKLIEEALYAGIAVKTLFVETEQQARYQELIVRLLAAGAQVYKVSRDILDKICDTKTCQAIAAVVAMKAKNALVLRPGGIYVALDTVQDGGNLGAVLRNADAFGIDGVILSPGCVDLYSPKVMRGSMGSALRVPVYTGIDLVSLLAGVGTQGFTSYAAALSDTSVKLGDCAITGGTLIVLGNEGNGITPEVLAACEKKMIIPMRGQTQSLNVAVASAIIMWECMKDR